MCRWRSGHGDLGGAPELTARPDPSPGRETEETEEQRAERLEAFLAFLVHELRNPLAVVRGFALALIDAVQKMDENTIRSSAAAIQRNAEHLGHLVDSISDAFSVETNRLRLKSRQVQLGDLVREILDDLTPILQDRKVRLDVESDHIVEVDVVRFKQALTNLVSNAVKYSTSGTPIAVSVGGRDRTARVAVTDEGPGVPAERADELFGKFSRLGAAGEGLGIGLFISRGIARAHGGDLFHVAAPNGNSFVLEIPVAEAD